jgi:hypothetical protein
MDWIVELNLVMAGFMSGLVVFVHVVHYPLLNRIDPETWISAHREHIQRTTWLVAPAMLIEMAAAVAWLVIDPGWISGIAFALIAVAWISTFAIQVPIHGRLERGFDARLHRKLCRSNLIRTIAWMMRSILILAMLIRS